MGFNRTGVEGGVVFFYFDEGGGSFYFEGDVFVFADFRGESGKLQGVAVLLDGVDVLFMYAFMQVHNGISFRCFVVDLVCVPGARECAPRNQ